MIDLNNLAWSLATSPEASLRNGAKAVETARRAMELSDGRQPAILDTLAAAYAEAGRFPEAVETVRKAIALASEQKQPDVEESLREKIAIYEAGKPFRETPQAAAAARRLTGRRSLPAPSAPGYNGGMNAVCLVFDRLHAGYVGAYGNSWIDTPAIDRLAAQSFLFDQAAIDSPEIERLYRSYWQGWHALCPAPPESRPSLPALLREAGAHTVLLGDEPLVLRHPLAADFDQRIEIDPPWRPQTASDIEQTHFGRCFVRMIEWLESAGGPFLLWCHLGGLGTTWDAPPEFRRAYQDEGDPSPPDGADVPDRRLTADYDPDELLGVSQSYADR